MAELTNEELTSVLLERVASQFEAQYQRKSLYNKNCVLTGCVDGYCLVCDVVLRSEEDAGDHIETTSHKKNLKKYSYVGAVFADCIRKINKRYYCEYCNELLATMPKILLHVVKQSHITNKNVGFDSQIQKTLFVRRYHGEVIAFESLLIDDLAWNGFIDNNCLVCDEELDDTDTHKNEVAHVINMIQSKIVEVGAINLIRQIDETMFQCLTCNVLMASNEMKTHFDEINHLTLHTLCKIAKNDFFLDEDTLDYIEEPNLNENREFLDEDKSQSTGEMNEEIAEEMQTDDGTITNVEETSQKIDDPELEDTTKIKMKKIQSPNQESRKQEKQGNLKKKYKKGKSNEDDDEFALTPTPHNYETEYERLLCEPFGLEKFIFTCEDESRTFCMLCDWNAFDVKKEDLENHHLEYHHKVLLDMEERRLKNMMMEPQPVLSKSAKKKGKKQKQKELKTPEKSDVADHEKGEDVSLEKPDNDDTETSPKSLIELEDLIGEKLDDSELTDTADADSSTENIQNAPHFGEVSETVAEDINISKIVETLEEKFSQFNLDPDFRQVGIVEKEPRISPTHAVKVNIPEDNGQKEPEISQKVIDFAEENLVSFNPELKEFHCTVCGNKVSAVFRKMQRHVSKHEKVEGRTTSPLQYQTMPFEEYVETIACVENLFRHDTVINNEKCVNILNFHMMRRQDGGVRCLACNDLSIDNINLHIDSDKHMSTVSNVRLLYTVHNEFVRELRDGVYHCGYCNIFETGYSKFEQHMTTAPHLTNREKSEHALVEYMFEMEAEYEHYVVIKKKECDDFMSMMKILSQNLSFSR